MIDKLTKEKLVEYGFEKDEIKSILAKVNLAGYVKRSNNGNFFVSVEDQKIYSGDDFFFKTESYKPFPYDNFADVPAYYNFNQKIFLNKEQKIVGDLLNEQSAKNRFKQYEIEKAKIGSSKFIPKPDQQKIDKLYIEWIVNRDEDDSDTLSELKELRDIIEGHFEPLKLRCFNEDDKDYNLLINLLTNFFTDKEYIIPKNKIQLKARCKTSIAPIFNKIYMQNKSSKTPLKHDAKYFEIIRILNHFQELSDAEIYITIGR